jgi:hypothetical protein
MSSFAATYTFGKTYDASVVPTELQTLVKNAYDSMLRIATGRRIRAITYRQNVQFNDSVYQVIYDTRLL